MPVFGKKIKFFGNYYSVLFLHFFFFHERFRSFKEGASEANPSVAGNHPAVRQSDSSFLTSRIL